MMSSKSDSKPKAKVARKTALGVKRKGKKATKTLTYTYHKYISEESDSKIEEVAPKEPPPRRKKLMQSRNLQRSCSMVFKYRQIPCRVRQIGERLLLRRKED
eukprot:4848041-Ditylum_brightwellii.AAC.1